MQYIWLGVLTLALIAEAVTAGLISIWFVPGALVAMILAFCNVPEYLQLVVFLGLSLIFLVLSRTIWKKYTSIRPVEPTNADALVGMTAIVTADINNIEAVGEVKVAGQHWSARSVLDGESISAGSHVKVVAIEGVKLICERTDTQSTKAENAKDN